MPSSPLNYSDLAADYAVHRRVQPALLQALADAGAVVQQSTVAEVGCGTGNYITAMAAATGCRAIGIEPNGAMLAQARARSGAITWQQASAETFALAPGSVDCVLVVDVIHHIGDRMGFFHRAHDALKPGGRLCIATDTPDILARRRPLAPYFPATIAVDCARYPHPDQLRRELTACGFNGQEEREVAHPYQLIDSTAYRDRAFSSLHLISEEEFAAGLARLNRDLAAGPIQALSLYWLMIATKDRR